MAEKFLEWFETLSLNFKVNFSYQDEFSSIFFLFSHLPPRWLVFISLLNLSTSDDFWFKHSHKTAMIMPPQFHLPRIKITSNLKKNNGVSAFLTKLTSRSLLLSFTTLKRPQPSFFSNKMMENSTKKKMRKSN